MIKNKVVFFGPKSEPVTGQNICFNSILNSYYDDSLVVDTTFINNRFWSALYCNMLFLYYINRYSVRVVYLTGSRSWLGISKEISIYLFKFYNYEIINHVHGYNINKVNQTNLFLLKPISYLLRNTTDTFVILNSQLRKQLSNVRGKVCVVDNFYSKSFEKKYDFNQKSNHIVYLSNIIETKGIFVFLESLYSVFKENNEWKVIIAGGFLGNTKIKKFFLKKINDLKLKFPNQIIYRGILNENEKIDLLSSSKVFVLPSFYESECVPLSIIESMRTGNHIIVTDHNILPSIVSPIASSIVKVKNVKSLSQSILDIINNESMQKKSFKINIDLAKSRYNEDSYIKNLKNIIG